MQEPIKVFVGADPNGHDAESMLVLEYSLRKNSSMPVELEWMMLSHDPDSFWYSDQDKKQGWNTTNYATPFSAFRWGIPARCNFEGKAIYMDSDMIVLNDIAKLWNQPFQPGKVLLSKGPSMPDRFCVSVWDCAEAKKYLPPIDDIRSQPTLYNDIKNFFAYHRSDLVQPFVGNWNCVDGEDKSLEEIDILHHSSMEHQLCHKYSLPRLAAQGKKHWYTGHISDHWRPEFRKLFDDILEEALAAGYKIEDYIPTVGYGHFNKQHQDFRGNAHQFVR